jgi:hypothetical protein
MRPPPAAITGCPHMAMNGSASEGKANSRTRHLFLSVARKAPNSFLR